MERTLNNAIVGAASRGGGRFLIAVATVCAIAASLLAFDAGDAQAEGTPTGLGVEQLSAGLQERSRTDVEKSPVVAQNGKAVPLVLEARLLLEGSYRVGSGGSPASIGTDLVGLGSPAIPLGTVDEVTVELVGLADQLVASATAYPRADTWELQDVNGGPVIFNVAPGQYFVRIHHRNHLTVMTSYEVDFFGGGASVDFTDRLTPIHDGERTTAGLDLPGNPVAMIAGDATNSGLIDADDRSVAWAERNLTGYLASDVNLDGVSDGRDRSIIWNNRNRGEATSFLPARVTAGRLHTCVLGFTGTAQCFGDNNLGQLGDGTTNSRTVAKPVIDLVGAVTIDADALHTCATTFDGRVFCWGLNNAAQLGHNQPAVYENEPVAAAVSDAVDVVTGTAHTCVLDSKGNVLCWGRNNEAQLGDGTMLDSATPVATDLPTVIVQIDAADFTTCAVDVSGIARCWGSGVGGLLANGDGTFTDQPTPGLTTVAGPVRWIAVGHWSTCVATSNKVLCAGQSAGKPPSPVLLDEGVLELAVSVDNSTARCAVTVVGSLLCWGDNPVGVVGTFQSGSPVPVDEVLLPASVVDITQNAHACAIIETGALFCWGEGSSGKTGMALTGIPVGQANQPVEVDL